MGDVLARSVSAQSWSGEDLARVATLQRIENAPQVLHDAQVDRREQQGHLGNLLDPDPVLARDAAAELDASLEDFPPGFEDPLDLIPIALVEEPESSLRGSMTLRYTAEDDYALASAEVVLKKLPSGDGDPDTAWAREDLLKGPRFPLDRPPPLPLRLPAPNAKNNEAKTQLELDSHPWAGLNVTMTLEAKDHAGQIGRSAPVEMVMPMRLFRRPLARAVIEQRQKLVEDDRYRPQVLTALEALTLAPEDFIKDSRVYLGLRSVYHRLKRDRTRLGMKEAIEQLWHVALRIEDGDLSDAERRFRELREVLQDRLEACLNERGYRQFALTSEQREVLEDLDRGSDARRTYLHSLASDGAVLDAQPFVAD